MRDVVSPLDGFRSPLGGRASAPQIITATSAPTLAALEPGDTPATGFTSGTYESSANGGTATISTETAEASINGGAYSAAAMSTVLSDGDTVAVREVVVDSAANERTFSAGSRTVMYALGTAPSVADGQAWTVDDTAVNIDASASGANLTFSYALSGSTAGVTINSGTGAITGTPTGVDSGTATVTATDQYGREYTDTFTWTASLRAQATSGADLDLAYPEDIAITPQDLLANWTVGGNTLTFVSVSPSLPTGLSINSSGSLSGTPTTITADATYTLTMEDEYGRQTSDTFTLEITEVDTAPTTSAFTLGAQGADGDIALTVTDLSENATVGFVFTTTDQSAATAAAIKTAAEGGTALTDQSGISATQALTVGGGPYNISLPTLADAAYYWQAALWDAAGNVTKYTGGTIQIDTTPPGTSTLSPTDNGTGVAVDANLVITFDEGMKRQGTVELRNVGGSLIESFDISTDGTWSTVSQTDDRITLTPASNFTNAASLCVRWSGLEDDKGNPLPDNATDTTWNFDVVAAPSGPSLTYLDRAEADVTDGLNPTFALDLTGHVAGAKILFLYYGDWVNINESNDPTPTGGSLSGGDGTPSVVPGSSGFPNADFAGQVCALEATPTGALTTQTLTINLPATRGILSGSVAAVMVQDETSITASASSQKAAASIDVSQATTTGDAVIVYGGRDAANAISISGATEVFNQIATGHAHVLGITENVTGEASRSMVVTPDATTDVAGLSLVIS